MTPEQEKALKSAIRHKLGLPAAIGDLCTFLPAHHQLSLDKAADFVLRRFAVGDTETETQIIWSRSGWQSGQGDKLREDSP